MNFDNSLCGKALLRLYAKTKDEKYLISVLKSAEWTINEPAVPNWNFNSFSVGFLSEVYRNTGDVKYLDAAKEKARLGIYPGQIQEGDKKGRWLDAHNSSTVYHYIIIENLINLLSVLPEKDSDYSQAKRVFELAVKSGNQEILQNGFSLSPIFITALASYALNYNIIFQKDLETQKILKSLVSLQISQFYKNKFTEPKAWGMILLLIKKELV